VVPAGFLVDGTLVEEEPLYEDGEILTEEKTSVKKTPVEETPVKEKPLDETQTDEIVEEETLDDEVPNEDDDTNLWFELLTGQNPDDLEEGDPLAELAEEEVEELEEELIGEIIENIDNLEEVPLWGELAELFEGDE